jgi:hypothetical protein
MAGGQKKQLNKGPQVVLRLGEELHADVNGAYAGMAPNESVAVLAVLLARSGTGERSRLALAKEIYPRSGHRAGRTALRQALKRLRDWIGAETVVTGVDRLAPAGEWTLEVRHDRAHAVASAYRHPFFADMWSETKKEPVWTPLARFSNTVRELARHDLDSARGMLLGAPAFARSLSPHEYLSLLNLTRPRSRTDPEAFEHCLSTAWAHSSLGELGQALEILRRGLRIATHAGRAALIARSLSMQLFVLLEMGDLAGAWNLVGPLRASPGRRRLLVDNAIAAFHWNSGDPRSALEIVKTHVGSAKGESRMDQLHFWVNAAVLAGEAEDHLFQDEALAKAETFLLPHLEPEARALLRLAELKRSCQTDPRGAAKSLSQLHRQAAQDGRLLLANYVAEALAFAHARSGDLARAEEAWNEASNFRRARGWRLSPRVTSLRLWR